MGKARPEMTLKELEETRSSIRERFPLRKNRRQAVASNPRPVVCAAPVQVQGVFWEAATEWRVS